MPIWLAVFSDMAHDLIGSITVCDVGVATWNIRFDRDGVLSGQRVEPLRQTLGCLQQAASLLGDFGNAAISLVEFGSRKLDRG